MNYILEAGGSFDAAHYLKGYKGACAETHGHTWHVRVRWYFPDKLNNLGMVWDLKCAKQQVRSICALLDHKLLNTATDAAGACLLGQPTAEHIAAMMFDMLQGRPNGKYLYEVEIEETPGCKITYRRSP